MTTHRTTLIWPFMLALSFLFALSITAPRSWETVAHRSPLRQAVGIRIEWQTTMPSLIVSNVATAKPAPRTAEAYVPPVTPRLSAVPRTPAVEKTPIAEPSPIAKLTLAAEPKPVVEPQPAPVAAPVVAAPRLFVRPEPSPFVNSSPKADEPATPPTKPTEPVVAPTSPAVSSPVIITPPVAAAPVVAPVVAPTLNSPRRSGGLRQSGSPAPQSATAPVVAPIATPHSVTPAVVAPTPTPAKVEATVAIAAPAKSEPPKPEPASPKVIVAEPQQVALLPVEPKLTTPIVEPIAAVSIHRWWPEPVDLLARLEKLQTHQATSSWTVLGQLGNAGEPTAPGVVDLLDDLRTVAAEPVVADESRLEPQVAVELRLARHAMLRRVDVWESLTQVLRNETASAAVATDDPKSIELCLAELESQTAAAGETGRQWRNYLMIDSLRQSLRSGPQDRRAVAREVLSRFRQAASQQGQNDFLRQGPFARLDNMLRGWTEEEVQPQRLLAGIERFEQGGLPSDGRELAQESRLLSRSNNEAKQRLSVWLTSHYRNANVRVTFSDDLLNRMLPDSLKKQQAVNDTILGMPTRGFGTSRTGLSVKFIPSRDQLAVRLEAQGVINSQTRTLSGPVRMFHHNNATFAAHKDLLFSRDGIKVNPSVALSNANSKLRGMESDFDGVPLLSGIVASMALDKHDEKRPAALREAAWKTARRVEHGLDHDIEEQLKQGGSTLKDRVLAPLDQMKLEPEIIDLQTHEDRAVVRFRIAGEDQLAANTPRPRAYSDNFGSLQLHHSAANNIVDRLALQGRRFTPADLYRHVVAVLNLDEQHDLSKLPSDVEFQFAANDPLTLRFEEGKVELRLAIDELKCGERSWSNFVIRAQFKPQVIDGQTYLVRDGIVRLSGSQLRTTAQISLRTVCAKVFPDDMKVRLWPDDLRNDERFADLDIEQIDIRDGWLGLSIGPRPALSAAASAPASPAAQR
jgi:hypothetical protein